MTTFGDRLYHLGGAPVGLLDHLCPANVFMLVKESTSSTTYNSYEHWLARFPKDKLHLKVSEAENACKTKQNDTILVTPESHVWYGDTHSTGEALTWDKHNTHMVGMSPFTKGGAMRSRFGHSGATMANFMTMSGSSNLMANLYWMHGSSTGGAADINMMTISGHRNTWEGCHFSGPNDTTQSASADYTGFTLSSTSTHNYFKNCTFGGYNAVYRGANAQLTLSTTGQGNVFEDCIFMCRAAGTTTEFIDFSAATGATGKFTAIFLNCQFLNAYGNTASMADAIVIPTLTEATHAMLYFDSRCSFAGVDDVTYATKENLVWMGHASQQLNFTEGTTSDWKALGLAGHPES